MVRNILKHLFLLFTVVITLSCNRLLEGVMLLKANQAFKGGEYQTSIVSYLEGVDSERNKEFFYYNLGNVYTYLGEYSSAFSIWKNAEQDDNSKLKFNLLYNKGYLKYQSGSYQEAYDLFKSALLVIPTSINTKINLELSLSKIDAAQYKKSPEIQVDTDVGISEETTRILEYVRQKENMTWGVNHQYQAIENDW